MKNKLMKQLIGIANELIDIDPQCDLWTQIMEDAHAELEKEIGPVVNPDVPILSEPAIVVVDDIIEKEPTFWFGSTQDRETIEELCLKHDVTFWKYLGSDNWRRRPDINHQYEVIGSVHRLLAFCNDLRANIEKQPGFFPHSFAWFKRHLEETQDV